MGEIKYLKPTKEQEKIMEAERKAICNLTVPKKRRTPPKCLAHCINLDTYKCMVFCTSGDIHAAGKIFDRHIVSHDGKEKISSVIDRLFENYQPEGNLKMTGRTMDLECDDMICHFPYLYPNPAILANELLHAVQEILKNKGVHDTNGEADAYLLSQLMEFFWDKFERDRKRYGGHH